jgi:TonB-linked SusC/RagA family outer membrane protein
MKNIFRLFFLLITTVSFAQKIDISGVIYDSNGPLPQATILVKNSSTGTTTDFDGKFNLTVDGNAILVVSFLGYSTQEIELNGQTYFQIKLDESSEMLDELVVIGYGSIKKRDLTGSISKIKAEEMMTTVVSSVDQGIQGKAAGVVVTFGSGQPGSKSNIRIRGTSSILGNLEPLYVIDGVPISTNTQNIGAVSGPSMNPLESLNPSDVESIEILKDASATAIYGTRGANGVILISTKKGKYGKPIVNVNYSTSIQQINHQISMLNASQLAKLANEAADNAGVDRREIFASPINLGVGTNWQDQIFRLAPMLNAQASVRGGTESTKYAISASYLNQDGIIIGSDYEKAIFRVNIDQNISDRLTIGTNINLSKNTLNGVITNAESAIPSSVTSWALEFNPGLPVFDQNGEYIQQNNTSNPPVGNPVEDANRTEQLTKSFRFSGNMYLQWEIIKNLKFKSFIASDSYNNEEKSFVPNDVYRGLTSNGQAAIANSEGSNWLFENTISYKKQIENHSLNAVIGYSVEANKNSYLFVATSDFDDNRLGYNAIQIGADKTLIFNGVSERQLQSYLGRLNYSFKDKYLLTLSTRFDGSSVFGDGNKFGIFPSMAAAWKIYDEDFFQNSKGISDMKVRLGIGRVGNQGIQPYGSMGLLEVTEAYYGENDIAKGFGPSTMDNSDLKWETTDQFDLGLDVALLDNRISVTTDFYLKKTKDLLLRPIVPYTTGFREALLNVGNLENKGFEFAITSLNIDKEDFKWNTNLNMSFNENKITNIESEEGIPAGSLLGVNGWTVLEVDKPIGNFYGYQSNGIIQSNEDPLQIPYFIDYKPSVGDRKYVDQNGDGILNEEDTILLGNANPDFSFGLGNSFEYKNWSLNIFISGVYGNEIANFNKFGLESFDGLRNNSTAALNRWTPANPTNDYPRANADPRRSNTLSDVQIEDGSYVKVRDITLSYNLNQTMLDKLKLSNVKFFMSAKNSFVFTNYSGYDPEVNRFSEDPLRSGVDYGSYPTSRIFTAGINVIF